MTARRGRLPSGRGGGVPSSIPQIVTGPAIMLDGGLDQLTPSLRLKPGYVRKAQNYECGITGGYARINGYERFDGRTSPSSAVYGVVQVTAFTNVPSANQTLTGQTSGATGTVIAVDQTQKLVILTKLSGTFTSSEVVKVGATVIGTATPIAATITPLYNAIYLSLAMDVYRALIGPVPGSGSVRGVVGLNVAGSENVYAFRDNPGGTATLLYLASVSGWTLVTLYNEVYFTAGGASAPADGATLTQGGNTATIKRVVLESGSWASNTAAGRFIVTTPSPGNFAAGAATIGGVNVTLSGAQTAISFNPGGKFEFDIGNFGGQFTSRRIYGCDTVNRGFEFDGLVLVPINTFATTDKPAHVRIHQNQLFFAIGSSSLSSGPGLPYQFNAAVGGAEIAYGDTITNFLVQPGQQSTPALLVTCIKDNYMLYGQAATGSNPWFKVKLNIDTGALAYTAQNLDQTYFFDIRGIITLQATLMFGNFAHASLTNAILPTIQNVRSQIVTSCVCKDRNQYRVFFNTGSALYLTVINGKVVGIMPQQFPDVLACVFRYDQLNGNEVIYAGGQNSGYVYQMERGPSFDGANIDAYLTLNWYNANTPRLLKSFRRASLEVSGSFYADMSVGYQLAYQSSELDQSIGNIDAPSNFSGSPFWDAFTWDMATWDGTTLSPSEVKVEGNAENIQFTISSTTNYINQYVISSIIPHYFKRRTLR